MIPQPGEQYRHFKSTGGNDHTYEIIGTALYTETGETVVIYKALYDTEITQNFFARPLSIRTQEVMHNDHRVKRFVKIE